MANKVLLKKSSVSGKVPLSTDLDFGELALNYQDGKIYYKRADNTISEFSSGAASAAGVTVSDTAPSSPSNGDLWWKSNEGALKVYYSDADSSQWVDAFPAAKNPGVATFNTRTGDVTLSSSDVTTALTYTPYNATNPSGYTTNTGTVTSVGGTGTVNGITLSGTVTSSGNLTLGGTLSNVSLTSQVTGTLPVANGGTGQTTAIFGGGLIKVEVVATLPGSPDANTLYIVTG